MNHIAKYARLCEARLGQIVGLEVATPSGTVLCYSIITNLRYETNPPLYDLFLMMDIYCAEYDCWFDYDYSSRNIYKTNGYLFG